MKQYWNIKKNFGFGMMRLPTKGSEPDYEEVNKMVDLFIENGFNYFDTAHGYMGTFSEVAVRKCVTSRYKREDYVLTDKLSDNYWNKREDIRPFFMSQLETCGVSYFDFYLMHAQNKTNYQKYKREGAYEEAFKLKEEGYIKHVGISFHDKHDVLDMILTENPEIEVVQIQFNYVDYEDPSVESRLCYEVCRKHNKPVIIMEPVKGGKLVNLPDEASKVLQDLNNGSNASFAIRFAASFDGVMMVLSGMSTLEMVEDNVSYMKDFVPLSDEEKIAIKKVTDIFKGMNFVPCTSCKYCMEVCPKHIRIPDIFGALNSKKQFKDWNSDFYYGLVTKENNKASDCIKCGACERICPQHLKIRDLLVEAKNTFEK